ncbi:hypothetical protein JB92DRAFT_3126481 [Gautieria morchelliformis]|nr:hypothetical protein JB92DRAFT_3126481 [Gautieria morchelliformis]
MPPRGKRARPGNPVVAPRKPQTRAAKTSADRMAADEEGAILSQEPSGVERALFIKKLTSDPPAQDLPTAGVAAPPVAQAPPPLMGPPPPTPPEARAAPETPPPPLNMFVADMPGAGALETEILQHVMEVFQKKTSTGTEYFVLTIPALTDLADTYSPLKSTRSRRAGVSDDDDDVGAGGGQGKGRAKNSSPDVSTSDLDSEEY